MRVATVYCLGEEARDVFVASGASEAKKNAEVFGVRKNLIFERARFNSRRVSRLNRYYLLVLHGPARNCEYGQIREELIRDRTEIGILDKALSKRLQLDPGLMCGNQNSPGSSSWLSKDRGTVIRKAWKQA